MRILGTVDDAAKFSEAAPRPLVFVPTMGALHAGHTALIDLARRRAGDSGSVVVSIFVNPTQFAPSEDLAQYPRPLEADLSACKLHGADAVFTPSVEDLYPQDSSTFVDESQLSQGLCGLSRPGHFRGVCTVVTKLFTILRPDVAVFGQKDYQQLAIIRRITRDLFLRVQIVSHPTVREADGLALSSRNRYLSPAEREKARLFPAALRKAHDLALSGTHAPDAIVLAAREAIVAGLGVAPEYVELSDAESLAPLASLDRPAVLAAAVRVGNARLIDNILITPPHGKV